MLQAEHVHHKALPFWRRYIFSLDHKVIGKQYLFTSFIVGALAGVLAMMIRLNLAWPEHPWPFLAKIFPHGFDSDVMKPEFYAALFTMHGTLMVFFFLSTALMGGFGNFLIPLQIGAQDMAFPFLNMLSYWTFVPGVLIMFASFFLKNGPAEAGWTSYPPLSAVQTAIPGSDMGQTFWIIGMAFFIASFTMGGLNFVTTILNMRVKGMTMMRLPLTTWAIFMVAILGILAFPALTAAVIMLLLDRHFGTSFYLPAGLYISGQVLPNKGGNPLLWQHLFWFLGHPEVYILMLPSMGFASDILSTFCRKPIFGYPAMVGAIFAIGALSFFVWGHHMFVSGMNPYLGMFFTINTMIIALPSAVKTFNWLATLWGAKIRPASPFLFAVGIVSLFITGGLSGIFLGMAAPDIQLHDTYFVISHFHFVMAGAALFGIFGGTIYWFPKMFGRMMNETLAKIHFWLTFITYYCTFYPMMYLGLHGMMRRLYDPMQYPWLKPLQPINVFISISAFLLGASQLIFVFNFFWSMFFGPKASNNPWNANGMEWTTSSPPPAENWDGPVPEVHRWPYDYSYPGAPKDYLPQTVPDSAIQLAETY
jgi:cytochrome c oxidase subunit 1